MAAQAESSLHSVTDAYFRGRMRTAFCGIALIAVAIGVLGLLGASSLRQMLEWWINIHELFGLLLCGLVFGRYRWCVAHSRRMVLADIRGLSRHLSRIVYLLLYLVLGAGEIVGVFNCLWHGGAADFNLFGGHFRRGSNAGGFDPRDDFQLFFASGFFALIFVRVLALRLWLRS